VTREEVVEEVAEAEMALSEFFDSYTVGDFEEMNERLRVLHNEAVSLQMPTTKIEELKLRVASAIGKAPATADQTQEVIEHFRKPPPTGDEPALGHPRPPQPSTEDREQAVKDLFS
jgi:hypothetical protein